MRIAVCEDDAQDQLIIKKILDEHFQKNGYTGEISVYESGEALLAGFQRAAFDVVFLDIYMGGINGIETAKKIRTIDPTCPLVFITSSRDHSLDGFSVRASAYVVKPIREKEMQNALFQCRDVFMKNARYIEIRSDRTPVKLPLNKIYYADIYYKTAQFHTADDTYKTRMTMDEIARELGDKQFCRCHQSYIVNMNHVKKITGNDILMSNNDIVPIRQRGRDEIRTEIAQFLSNRMFEGN